MDPQRVMGREVVDVEDQIRILVRLQELELAIRRFEEAIAAKPRELDPLMRVLDDARASATQHRKDLEGLERQRRQLESTIVAEQSNLQKAQRKLLEVKTNKEYTATLAEIEAFKQKISEHEDRVLQLMEHIELRKQELQELDRQIVGEEQRLAECRQRNEAELVVLQHTLAERLQTRAEAMQRLSLARFRTNLLDLYGVETADMPRRLRAAVAPATLA